MQSKRKICFVVAADMTLKFILLSELRFFRDKGYEVFAVCSPGKWLEDIKKEGVAVKEIIIQRKIFTPISDLISLVKMFFYFKKEKFDIVMTFTPKPSLWGQVAAKFAGVPIIINTIFGYYFHENMSNPKRAFFIFIEKLAASCSDVVFFRNKEDFQTSARKHIARSAKSQFIGDGIDIRKYNRQNFSQEFIEEKKKALGVASNVPVVGIVARLVREKGYLELFEAFKNVVLQFPDAVLLVVGPVDLQKKDSIRPQDFSQKNIIFLGERTDVAELMSVMNIFVLPSYREGFPHSVMEASATGLPVITTDVRGCRDAVKNNVTGLIIPPKSAKELEKAIAYLLANPNTAKSMGQAARQEAQTSFDKNILLKKMEEKIEMLIKEKL